MSPYDVWEAKVELFIKTDYEIILFSIYVKTVMRLCIFCENYHTRKRIWTCSRHPSSFRPRRRQRPRRRGCPWKRSLRCACPLFRRFRRRASVWDIVIISIIIVFVVLPVCLHPDADWQHSQAGTGRRQNWASNAQSVHHFDSSGGHSPICTGYHSLSGFPKH